MGNETRVVHFADRIGSQDWTYIGRSGRGLDGYFGNPFTIGPDGDRAEVISKYRDYFNRLIQTDARFAYRVSMLKGRTLVCFCKPLACHGDIIAEYLNNE